MFSVLTLFPPPTSLFQFCDYYSHDAEGRKLCLGCCNKLGSALRLRWTLSLVKPRKKERLSHKVLKVCTMVWIYANMNFSMLIFAHFLTALELPSYQARGQDFFTSNCQFAVHCDCTASQCLKIIHNVSFTISRAKRIQNVHKLSSRWAHDP